MQTELLLSKIKMAGMNVENFAKEIGISEASAYRKLKKGNFLIKEAEKTVRLLNLSKDIAYQIFFT